jgi:hypothetical protein
LSRASGRLSARRACDARARGWYAACRAFSMSKETTVIDDDPVAWQDRRQIDLAQSYEVRDWCKTFRCTKEELHDAVKAVGHTAGRVREYLER